MSRYRRNVDTAQGPIVETLLLIPGVSVIPGHDDILVGHRGRTYWYEIKSKHALRKDGTPIKGRVKKSQEELLAGWRGHYRIVSTVEEILMELGIEAGALTCGQRRSGS